MLRPLFYLQYAFRSLWRSRRWSAFAIFSVAAGVATVVALRSLGLAIGDSLIDSVRTQLKGDMQLSIGSSTGFFSLLGTPPEDLPGFSPRQLEGIDTLAQGRGWAVDTYSVYSNRQVAAVGSQGAGRLQFATIILVNPARYPLSGGLRSLDPPGQTLADLITAPNEVVVSQNFADLQGVGVGDRLRVSGTESTFRIVGIAPSDLEAGLQQIFAAFFGFVYFDVAASEPLLGINPNPNRVSVLLPGQPEAETIVEAENDLRRVIPQGNDFIRIETVPELLEINSFIADLLGRLIVIMGLGAVLIGGVGIINTMLVMVRRRSNEIAALKTFGLKRGQVAALFIAEGLLLGLAGSVVGSVIGVLLSGLANNFGAALIQQSLTWRIYPEALIFGLALGVVVSVVFSVLPVLTAVRVRPAVILRPNETHIPASGCLDSVLALALVVIAIGVIAGQILGSILFGMIGVAVTLLILGLLILLLWVVVWLVGKLPSFGIVDLRLALRNLSTRRFRTATTLLALSAGMFALSSITFFGTGVSDIIRFTLQDSLGGNVLILPVLPPPISQPLIDARLDTIEGLEARTQYRFYSGAAHVNDVLRFTNILVRDSDNPDLGGPVLSAGRQLTAADRGQPVALVRAEPDGALRNLQVGERIVIDVNGAPRFDVEVVGIMAPEDVGDLQSAVFFGGDVVLPPGLLDVRADFVLNLASIAPEHLNEGLLSIASLPLVFAVDVSFIDGLVSRFIAQFSALPLLVGLFSLAAAAVILANTVALATLERRRQIGILKAVGLKGRRVLYVMLLENVLVSVLGGVLGISLSAVGVWIMTTVGLEEAQLIPAGAGPIALLLILAAVGIGVLATLLSASVAIRERVLNVLRYE